ncbi:hypothetical protein HBR94_19125 [Pseudomonas sp. WS 5412]|uniref:hypothetical protein n=1 Tax=unclassified Pseudomonas TaxID=196821 RepID=UPI0007173DD0|nr:MULTISPECIES: hypothetical protein [unclassified Pseudomonas]MBJ2240717.1 hypothetical protein [Pseudomonas sp. MF6768]MBK3437674.1 hypothetical protein [Pseudomonas sp. MF7448]MBU4629632.1 hypothetical protein [Pseudomonas sp. BF61]NMY33617.1 hypothetical protein [Pseudomonas sp. WS 5412]
MTSRIVKWILFFYCLSTVLLPVFVLNKLFFVPLFLMAVYVFISRPIKTIAPVVVFLIFLYGFLLGLLGGADADFSRQMILGAVSLFLIYSIVEFKVDMALIVKAVGAIFALIMCVFSFMLMVEPGSSLSVMLLDFYNANELGYYGLRSFGGLDMFMLHHRSSPFLLLPLSLFFLDFLQVKRFWSLFFVVVILMAIIWSASRGLIVMAAVSMLVLYFYNKNWSARLLMLCALVPVIILGVGYLLTETSMFSSDEQSNNIKIGHIISFLNVADWKMLVFGNGLGTYYYTEGYGELAAQTEITWMDSVRYVGLPLSLLLFSVLLFPNRKYLASVQGSSSRLIMFMYLLMSLSNPVLFNSFGFLVILWYWSVVIKNHEPSALHAEVRR